MAHPLALVIGVGPGIGLAVARRFAREGYAVALVAQSTECLAEFYAAVERAGAPAVYALAADVADAEALRRAFDRIREEHKDAPEVLVYNASMGPSAPASQLPPEDLVREFRVNVLAALESAQMALPAMRTAGRGTLLFTGGGLALAPQATQAGLSIGKAGLRSLALCLAEELAPENIHVATVTVAGFVQSQTAFSPEAIAEHFWALHTEPRIHWRHEVVAKP
jgi:NAD(P)-dependent dehydrogenase (short-subunit alcohol dehydrogenase family)